MTGRLLRLPLASVLAFLVVSTSGCGGGGSDGGAGGTGGVGAGGTGGVSHTGGTGGGPTDLCLSLTCDDDNECTANECDPGTGCNYPALDNGELCNDGSGTCQAGTCEPACVATGPEVCDGIDNDCNGVTDDEPVCVGVNRPPVLADSGPYDVVVGSSLTFTLPGSDPDGDALTYSVTPLPLPSDAMFDTSTGVFHVAPGPGQIGSYPLTFTVRDGQFKDSDEVTLNILAPPPGQTTELAGRVLDTTDALDGIDTPVVGATISIIGTPYETITDSDGRFLLTGIPAGGQVFDINPFTAANAPDGSPYAGFREEIVLYEGALNDHQRPFYLPRIATESLTTVNPNETTVVTNSTLGITMTVPPNTAKGPNGADFTGELSISLVPEGLAPEAMPSDLGPGLLITIQPVGVTFATPVPISFPNAMNGEPGNEVNIWSLDPEVGRFVVVGKGEVSPDGTRIETVQGGIRAADWHFPLPLAPLIEFFAIWDDEEPCRRQ